MYPKYTRNRNVIPSYSTSRKLILMSCKYSSSFVFQITWGTRNFRSFHSSSVYMHMWRRRQRKILEELRDYNLWFLNAVTLSNPQRPNWEIVWPVGFEPASFSIIYFNALPTGYAQQCTRVVRYKGSNENHRQVSKQASKQVSRSVLIILICIWELSWITKDTAQRHRVEGSLRAHLAATLLIMSDKGAQLRWKGLTGINTRGTDLQRRRSLPLLRTSHFFTSQYSLLPSSFT